MIDIECDAYGRTTYRLVHPNHKPTRDEEIERLKERFNDLLSIVENSGLLEGSHWLERQLNALRFKDGE